jgi:putative hydrolase
VLRKGQQATFEVIADYHTHTIFSHGQGTVRMNAQAASDAGLRQLAIADHGPAMRWGLGVESLEEFETIRNAIDKVNCQNQSGGLTVLRGCEANIIDFQGTLDIPPYLQHDLDIVLAGFHVQIRPRSFVQGLSYLSAIALSAMSSHVEKKERIRNTDAVCSALYNNCIDILTHPGLHINIDTAELAKASVQTGTLLEINCHHADEMLPFVKVAARHGARFVISSDAHHPDHIGKYERGLAIAREAGLCSEQIMNVIIKGEDPEPKLARFSRRFSPLPDSSKKRSD